MISPRKFIFVLALPLTAYSAEPQKPSVVPAQFQWVRSLDVEGSAGIEDHAKEGVQSTRVRLRYKDPVVNAFIGMQAGATHFNRELALESPDNPRTGSMLWDLGANIGVVRGRHLWELDLMGVTAAGKLAGGLAIVGEHRLISQVYLVHRWQVNAFAGDGNLDADQGFSWMLNKNFGVTAGYRIFSTMHSNHNNAHIGLRLYFESPKIPYIFPSIG